MKNRINREIGSEFSYEFIKNSLNNNLFSFKNMDEIFTFSGRTAIETILNNLENVNKVLLPSYCCDSIIEPFRKKKMEINFYDVYFSSKLEMNLQINEDIDLILWCNYFGSVNKMPDFQYFINNGGIIVEDITHSLLSKKQYHNQSHYLVASLRKWFPLISGGYCCSMINKFKVRPEYDVPKEYINLKRSAMIKKSKYLKYHDIRLKEEYLKEFKEANSWLSGNYSNLKIDSRSLRIINNIDLNNIIKKRKNNANIIYTYLNDLEGIKPLFKEINIDCPIFVPVIFKDKQSRNMVKNKLIENNIYCPVHWPKSKEKCHSNLYDLELSLICDQRYNESDMVRMMEIISKIQKGWE